MASLKPTALKPTAVTLRTYQVGFGDCFLLSFRYPPAKGKPRDRHVLIDFGSTGRPKGVGEKRMLDIAHDIKAVCGGKLHAVVATHRHKDHISGFTTNQAGTASGDVIASLKPEVVVQPWTEHPRAQPDATGPPRGAADTRRFTAALSDMHAFAAAALDEVKRSHGKLGVRLLAELSFLGEDNLANLSAVENLMTMGRRHRYVSYGTDSGLGDVLPGVKTTVLGPPTLKQSDSIRQQRTKDEAEFWHFQAAAGRSFTAAGRSPFAARHQYAQRPAHARWFIQRMDALRGDQLLAIVRALDQQMNNTSVILLVEAGGKKLLFPGDAQIENWSYALEQAGKKPALRRKLEAVDLYKVGHHGSLNATPKSLWALFERKGPAKKAGRLTTVVSTLHGKHGKPERGTEVPRRKLVEELAKQSELFSTEELKGKAFFHDVTIDL